MGDHLDLYKQPDFYRFNEDSTKLVEHVIERVRGEYLDHVLDLGSGCGILGIELSRFNHIKELDFVELQPQFIVYLEQNVRAYKVANSTIYKTSFSNFKIEKKYDLIISNPPYYNMNSFRTSPDPNRAICRHFLVDDIHIWFNVIRTYLAPKGKAYFVLDEEALKEIQFLESEKIFKIGQLSNSVFIEYLRLQR